MDKLDLFNDRVKAIQEQTDREARLTELGVRFNPLTGDNINQAYTGAEVDTSVPDTSTVSGQISNELRSFGSGVERLGAYTKAAVPAAMGIGDLYFVPQEARDAYSLLNNPEAIRNATQEQIQQAQDILNQKNTNGLGSTHGEMIQDALSKLSYASDTVNDPEISAGINQANRQELSASIGSAYKPHADQVSKGVDDLGKGDLSGLWDIASGMSQAAFAVPSETEDPVKAVLGATEYIAENIPQLFLGGLGKIGLKALAASNIGYGASTTAEGVIDFAKREGRLSTDKELLTQVAYGAGAAGLEQLSDKFNIDAAKALGKSIRSKVAKEAVADTAKEVVKSPSKVASTLRTGADSFIREGTTEYLQTIAEDKAKLKDADLGAAFEAGIIGGISGAGTTATTGVGLGGVAKGYQKLKNISFANGAKELKADSGNIDAAVKKADGDVSTVNTVAGKVTALDKQTVDTDPDKAIDNVKQANTIISSEKFQIDALTEALTVASDKKQHEDILERIIIHQGNIKRAEVALTNLQSKAILPIEEVDSTIDSAVQGDEQATRRSFGSFASKPTSLTSQQATKLAESDKLTPTEQAQLKTYAKIADNITDAGTVNDEILNGAVKGKKFNRRMLGINDYQNNIYSFLQDNNTELANKSLEKMNNFNEGHLAKLALMDKAIAEYNGKGLTPETSSLLKSVVGLTIDNKFGGIKGFTGLRDKVANESQLINNSYQALSQLVRGVNTSEEVQSPTETTKTSEKASEEVTEDKPEPIKDDDLPPWETQPTKTEVKETKPVKPKKPKPVITKKDGTQRKLSKSEKKRIKAAKQQPKTEPVKETKPTVTEDFLTLDAIRDHLKANKGKLTSKEFLDWYIPKMQNQGLKALLKVIGSLVPDGHYIVRMGYTNTGTIGRAISPEIRKGNIARKGEIVIYRTVEGFEHVNPEEMLTHEFLHAISVSLLRFPKTPRQKEAAKRLNTMAKYVRANIIQYANELGVELPWKGVEDYLLDPAELIAYAFTNDSIQQILTAMPSYTGKESVWVSFVNLIKNMFGLPTNLNTLSDIIALSSVYFENATDLFEQVKQDEPIEISPDIQEQIDQHDDTPPWETETEEEISDPFNEPVVIPEGYSFTQQLLGNSIKLKEKFQIGNNLSALETDPNFLQNLISNPAETLSTYFDNVTQDVLDTAQSFSNLTKDIHNRLDQAITVTPVEAGKDFTLPLSENGVLLSNVKTAVAVGIYKWMVIDANTALTPDENKIRKQFNLDAKDPIPPQLFNKLKGKGQFMQSFINSIGSSAYKALNLSPTSEALVTDKGLLVNTLGQMALGAMGYSNKTTRPLITSGTINTVDFNKGLKEKYHITSAMKLIIPTNNKGVLTQNYQNIIDNNKQPQFLDRVFGSIFERPLPTLEPVESNFRIRNSSTQVVPSKARKFIKHLDNIKWKINKNYHGISSRLDNRFMRDILGWTDDTNDFANKLAVHRVKLKSANNQIDKEIKILTDYTTMLTQEANGLDTPFFIKNFMTSNQRVMMDSALNPQSTKAHRFAIYADGMQSTIDLNNQAQVDQYLMAVGESLDLVADKKKDEIILQQVRDKLATPVIADAVTILQQMLSDPTFKPTPEQTNTLKAGVHATETKSHGFAGLMSYAEFLNTKESGSTTFEHHLMRECDGITNGIAFNAMQFPSDDEQKQWDLFGRVGIYQSDAEYYASWKEVGANKDSYEALAANWKENIEQFLLENPRYAKAFTGALSVMGKSWDSLMDDTISVGISRNDAKSPLLTTLYGAGIEAIMEHFSEAYTEAFYDLLQQAYDEGNTTKINVLVGAMNDVISLVPNSTKSFKPKYGLVMRKKLQVPKLELNSSLLDTEIGYRQQEAIHEALVGVFKQPLSDALNESYGGLLEARKLLHATSNITFDIFNKIYKKKYQEVLEAKLEKYRQENDGKDMPKYMQVLTVGENKQLFKSLMRAMPIMKTVLGQDSQTEGSLVTGDYLNEGIIITKTKRESPVALKQEDSNFNDQPYKNRVNFKEPIMGSKSVEALSSVDTIDKAPSTLLPLTTQSMDSGTIVPTQYELKGSMSMFDALGTGQDHFNEGNQLMNKNFLGVNDRYSIGSSVLQMFQRVGNQAKQEGIDLSEIDLTEYNHVFEFVEDLIKGDIVKGVNPLTNQPYINEAANHITEFVNTKNTLRKKYIGEIGTVGQYYDGKNTVFHPEQTNKSEPITPTKLVEQVAETPTEPQVDNRSTTFEDNQLLLKGVKPLLDPQLQKVVGLILKYMQRMPNKELPINKVIDSFFGQDIRTLKGNVKKAKHLQGLITDQNVISISNKIQKSAFNFDKKFGLNNFKHLSAPIYKQIDDFKLEDDTGTFKGSSATQDLLNDYTFTQVEKINKLNSEEVFEELGKNDVVQDSPEHTKYLRNLLTNVVNQVLVPFKLHTTVSTETETIGATNGQDMYIVNQMHPKGRKISGMLANGIRMSAREVYVHELLHNVTAHAIETNQVLQRELTRLWSQAKAVIKPEDFLSNPNMDKTDPQYKSEMKAAQARYDHIFTLREDKQSQDHLHEFVAMAANEQFMKALAGIPLTQVSTVNFDLAPNKGLVNKISNWITKAINYVGSRLSGTYRKSADQQLQALILNLANVDSGSKAVLRRRFNRLTQPFLLAAVGLNKLATPVSKFEAKTKQVVGKIAAIPEVKKATSEFLSQIDTIGEGFRDSNNSVLRASASLFGSLATEAKGRFNQIAKFQDIKRVSNKIIDQDRESIVVTTKNTLEQKFNQILTKDEKRSLFYYMKTAPTNLISSLGTEETIKLLTDKQYLKNKITDVQNQLRGRADYEFLINQAVGLGRFMATGETKQANQLLNSDSIVHKLTQGGAVDLAAKPLVAQLASMIALREMQSEDYRNLGKVISREMFVDTSNNGFTFVNALLQKHLDDSINEFKDNPFNRIEGYVVDINNQDIDIKVGSALDEYEFANQGYAKGGRVSRDMAEATSSDNQETQYLYVNRNGGLNDYLAGAVNLFSQKARGTSLFDLHVNAGSNTPFNGSKAQLAKMISINAKASRTNNKSVGVSLQSESTHMVPNFDTNGNIIGYRYLMKDSTKDNYLERDTSYDAVLGRMLANSVIKPRIREQNIKLVHAMHEQFKQDYTNNTSNYVTVSPDASDPRLAEIWGQLPHSMKQEIRKVWKHDAIIVPRESIDMLFGYRKYSLASSLQGLKGLSDLERTQLQKAAVNVLGAVGLLSNNSIRKLGKAENIIQDLVKIAKEIIVIKTGVVTLGNTISNMIYLINRGVNPWDVAKNYAIAGKALIRYKKQDKEVRELNQLLLDPSLASSKRKTMTQRKLFLEDDIRRNPIKDMIREGVLQHIVEDVSRDTDVATKAKGYLEEKLNKVTAQLGRGIPPIVKTIASEVLVLKGSTLYTVMNEAAQFSDFGARYVLYEHLTKKKGQSQQKALGDVIDSFIDYDLPTHKGIQYLNDMGILQFTKYLIRIQKQILRLFKDNPARTLLIMMTQGILGNAPDVVDTFLDSPATRITNPLSMLVGAHDEMFTAQIAGSVF